MSTAKALAAKVPEASGHSGACSLLLRWWTTLAFDLLLIIREVRHLLKCSLPLSLLLSSWFFIECIKLYCFLQEVLIILKRIRGSSYFL